MIKIGIIGDIGSGKSYVAKRFGYPVFNADVEVGKLYKKNRKIVLFLYVLFYQFQRLLLTNLFVYIKKQGSVLYLQPH